MNISGKPGWYFSQMHNENWAQRYALLLCYTTAHCVSSLWEVCELFTMLHYCSLGSGKQVSLHSSWTPFSYHHLLTQLNFLLPTGNTTSSVNSQLGTCHWPFAPFLTYKRCGERGRKGMSGKEERSFAAIRRKSYKKRIFRKKEEAMLSPYRLTWKK